LWTAELKDERTTLDDFDEYVSFITYGDDVIAGVHKDKAHIMNRRTVMHIGNLLGMELTSAAKDENCAPFDLIDHLTFLKSSFVGDGDVFLAPLPIKVIHRELLWQRKANDGNVTIFDQRVTTAMQFMSHHGREAVEKLIKQLADNNITVNFSYTQWRYELWNKQSAYFCNTTIPPVMSAKFFTQMESVFQTLEYGERHQYLATRPLKAGLLMDSFVKEKFVADKIVSFPTNEIKGGTLVRFTNYGSFY